MIWNRVNEWPIVESTMLNENDNQAAAVALDGGMVGPAVYQQSIIG